ncbi:hypothetical protein PVAG01_07777 [Phlyctema vagabunda]|uniref:Amidohydrolase-related domain-containing protein n=1 Tax=Phlyctema vagabunda TaxID=108571 RepID=A0ABR4PDE6_9HELO
MASDDVFKTSPEVFNDVWVTGKPTNTKWNINCKNGCVESVVESGHSATNQKASRLLCPSLCHPHIHLDKCFLLSHPRYADLEVKEGDFAEALSITSEAKSRFTHEDLMERGRALVNESINFGVTHMRAFVEVDQGVKMKCLDAGLALKAEFKDRCHIQICVFAQDPIFSYKDQGEIMIGLLQQALSRPGVEVLGSTPYVEKTYENQVRNIEWTLRSCLERELHVDFHMDYNLEPRNEVFTVIAIQRAKEYKWPVDNGCKTIVFGHCTRLSLFTKAEWRSLKKDIGQLPVSFVGLPTSDLFMMGRPGSDDFGGGERVRGTLQILQMIEEYGLDAAIGINNVGNAFTPQGSCDPLALASLGVGIYQAGTTADAELLLQCVSNRAKTAIGIKSSLGSGVNVGDPFDFVIFGDSTSTESFRRRKTTQDLVYDAGHERQTVFHGKVVSR